MSRILAEVVNREELTSNQDTYKGACVSLEVILSEFHRIFEGDYQQQIVALKHWLESEIKEIKFCINEDFMIDI